MTTTRRRWPLTLALVAITAMACAAPDAGSDPASDSGATAAPGRTVEVTMTDLAFSPASITVADGETVRVRFTNDGELPHDAFVGDAAAQDAHGAEMAEAGGGHGGHGGHGTDGDDAGDAVTVDPGETGELLVTGTASGELLIGCHQPGHYEAGMVMQVASG
ncbi:cupredoxin domain-containing protein [Euzebya rosea]|uniref:cupredoxin domain-containing protein n=1 Tax=Euzebya rosea TaxID=2052804 RepID=UPI0013002B10|nr:cupredoxin domain-containing protein [Euzebya rosea]